MILFNVILCDIIEASESKLEFVVSAKIFPKCHSLIFIADQWICLVHIHLLEVFKYHLFAMCLHASAKIPESWLGLKFTQSSDWKGYKTECRILFYTLRSSWQFCVAKHLWDSGYTSTVTCQWNCQRWPRGSSWTLSQRSNMVRQRHNRPWRCQVGEGLLRPQIYVEPWHEPEKKTVSNWIETA